MQLLRQRSALVAALLLVAATAAAAAFTPNKDPKSRQLSSSVLVMGAFDWELSTGSDGKPWSRCLDSVWRARRLTTGNRLNFVPTHHWLPGSDGFGVSQFCYLHSEGSGDTATCMAWTPAKLAEFKRSMGLCLGEALKAGFIPYIRPHLDDGLVRGIWRNGLLFNPLTKYGSYSYQEIMLDPLAEAVREALVIAASAGNLTAPHDRTRPVVYMALQGEMSATVMRYTKEWASLVPKLKSTIGSQYADIKVGVGLNFNALDAVETDGQATRHQVPAIDGAAVKELVSQTIDFIGISAYAPYSDSAFPINEFENSAFNVADALASVAKVNLTNLINTGKLELHYSEFGIGGGRNGHHEVATSADGCAKQPWAGLAGAYHSASDPWQRHDLSSFRDSFYTKVLEWLSKPNIKTYQVSEVFVWGMASWDLFAIYPESTSKEGSYRGVQVVKKIAHYNTAVIASQVCARDGKKACKEFAKANAACLADKSGAACLGQQK